MPEWVTPAALAVAAVAAAGWALEARRRRAAARGAASLRWLGLIAQNANDALLLLDESGRILEANERAAAMYGWPREALLGMTIRDLREPSTLADLPATFERVKAGEALVFETVHRRRSGEPLPVEVSTVSRDDGSRKLVQSVIRDITDRKRAERALRESEERFRRAFHDAAVGFAILDSEGRFLEWNGALEGMLGRPGEELRVMGFRDLIHPEDRDRAVEAFGRLVRGERDHHDARRRYFTKDGRVVHLKYSISALRDEEGRFQRAIGIVEDVTGQEAAERARLRIQARLALADRMASLGTMASGLAHEINNPLSYVIANVRVARQAAEELLRIHGPTCDRELKEIAEALVDAAEGAGRVQRIVTDLRVLSRPGGERSVLDLRPVVEASANVARGLVVPRAALSTSFGDAPPVEGDPAQLGQVFVNLLVNAAQALPEGRPEAHAVRVRTFRAADGRAAVEVADTGEGIPRERLAEIFDPFFTTRPSGVGTGLGLAICQSIVAEHGGEIQVESAVGKGSTFRVLIPAAGSPAPGIVGSAGAG